MGMFESKERKQEIINEMENTWTKYRVGDICKIQNCTGGMAELNGQIVTIVFPYYFQSDNEQTYLTKEYVFPFKESELKFIKQKFFSETEILLDKFIKSEIAIHCQKEEDAIKLCLLLNDKGIFWFGGWEEKLIPKTSWERYGQETVYYFSEKNNYGSPILDVFSSPKGVKISSIKEIDDTFLIIKMSNI